MLMFEKIIRKNDNDILTHNDPISKKNNDSNTNNLYSYLGNYLGNYGMHDTLSQILDSEENISEHEMSNKTAIPDSIKHKVETESNESLDDVVVHYLSDRPSKFDALAYTQGNQVYIAPGQEDKLEHELWHVVQQKRNEVFSTGEYMGSLINVDPELEQRAEKHVIGKNHPNASCDVIQLAGEKETLRAIMLAICEDNTKNTFDFIYEKLTCEERRIEYSAADENIIKTKIFNSANEKIIKQSGDNFILEDYYHYQNNTDIAANERIVINTKTQNDTLKLFEYLIELCEKPSSGYSIFENIYSFKGYFMPVLNELDIYGDLIKKDKVVIYYKNDKDDISKNSILSAIQHSKAEIFDTAMSSFYATEEGGKSTPMSAPSKDYGRPTAPITPFRAPLEFSKSPAGITGIASAPETDPDLSFSQQTTAFMLKYFNSYKFYEILKTYKLDKEKYIDDYITNLLSEMEKAKLFFY